MFRRSKTESDRPLTSAEEAEAAAKTAGKGRPTPTRKEAEAANKERAKVPRTRKEQMQRQRAARTESSQTIRSEMKKGNEKYLLPRDKGPVRRFIRDFVDSRFSISEVVIPLMIVTLVFPALILLLFPVLFIDLLVLRYRVRKQLAIRFPDAPLKGTTYYMITRAMQLKFMRLPKAQVKIGDTLPEHYR